MNFFFNMFQPLESHLLANPWFKPFTVLALPVSTARHELQAYAESWSRGLPILLQIEPNT